MESGVEAAKEGAGASSSCSSVAGLVGVAFARNRALTSDLDWPAFETQSREVAFAQTLLDEGFGPDFSYQGEYLGTTL